MKKPHEDWGFSKKDFMFDSVSVCVCVHECRYPERPEDGVRPPGAGVTAGHEPPHTGAGSHTSLLREQQSSEPFQPLSLQAHSRVFRSGVIGFELRF